MTKLMISLLGAGVLATGGYAAANGLQSDPARTVSLPAATSTNDDTTTAGTTTAATTAGTTTAGDISGPCDEAEHRNDPRCTGGAAADDDNSGPGGGGDDGDDDDRGEDDDGDDDDDRSGSNSGKG
jgi:hypothetical protein